jgi:POT family proton-dependent oligopeptide transporter
MSLAGHPRGLYTLFFTEMWERFNYYGMRALLILYLTAQLLDEGGFGLVRQNALTIYAIFTFLVYITPIIGGWLADKVLGRRKAVFIGAITMAIGQFALAATAVFADSSFRESLLYYALAVQILGNGFFKPNISTIVGELYEDNDPRKDGGFTIFYMGINLGAFIAPLICGTLGQKFGWEYGFGAAGIGMLLGFLWFYFQGQHLGDGIGFPPSPSHNQKQLVSRDWVDVALYSAGTLILALVFVLVWFRIPELARTITIYTMAISGSLALLWVIFNGTQGKTEWSRVGVILVLAFFNVLFWAGFEQAGGTFNLFAQDNTNRMLFGWEIPAAWFQSINAIAIFTIAPLFSMMWTAMDKLQKNPRTPVKFAMGLVMLSLGFFVMAAAKGASAHGLVSPLWLVSVFVLHTLGELMLSPIGLSMITKLAPKRIVSVMMGLWMGSVACGNLLAGLLEGILHRFNMELYTFIAIETLVAAGILLAISPFLNRAMKGIH